MGSSFCHPTSSRQVSRHKKSTENKGYLPEQVLMQMKMLYSGKSKWYLLVRKRAPQFEAGRDS